jgi:serine protease Do
MRRAQQLASLQFRCCALGFLALPCVALLASCAGSGTPLPAHAPHGAGAGVESAAAPAAPTVNVATASPSAAPPGWLTTSKPELRALTVVVRSDPPAALQSKFKELAARYRPLRPLFAGSAEEAFGSGFVMVWHDGVAGAPSRVFIVTNRHVVGLASHVRVMLGTAAAPVAADVAYVDDRYDLAVLSLAGGEREGAARALTHGFALADAAVHDQDLVVASGYPGIDGRPSYQVTRGFVSNERFELDDEGGEELYIQHTAPIDPGSSGGPLMTPDGKVLGVNTLKIRHRENVGLAVPASIVAGVLAVVAQRASHPAAATANDQAQAACEALLQQLRAESAPLVAIARSLGAELVVEHGLSSLSSLPDDGDWPGRFVDDPTEVFARAIALRLTQTSAAKSSSDAPASCTPDATGDKASGISFKAQLNGVSRRLGFALEQGRWKLTRGSFGASHGRSFLDGLETPRGPAKKWKPSLK